MQQNIKVIDLFSGVGGLTHGLELAGLNVVAGIDNDKHCEYGYNANNNAKFILKDITSATFEELNDLFKDATIKILVGCAPCQPYSKLNQKKDIDKSILAPFDKFSELITQIKPDIVFMENVRGIMQYDSFFDFIKNLTNNNYKIDYKVVNFADYGVAQNRKRFILLASRLGIINIPKSTHINKHITVRQIIGDLEPIEMGKNNINDPLHCSSKLNSLNLQRIKATPHNGGSQKSWSDELLLKCHQKATGQSFRSTYGRMFWDKPAPTLTTLCLGYGNGKYGHPEQNRAISLREAARIQSFPDSYKFVNYNQAIRSGIIARLIGNAVPIHFSRIIGNTIKQHAEAYE